MKNNLKGSIVPLLIVIIAILIIGGGIYIYSQKNKTQDVVNVENSNLSSTTVSKVISNNNNLTDEVFIKEATTDYNGKVVARGDVNGDGYEDAIVQGVTCGASCSINLYVVLNNKNTNTQLAVLGDGFTGYMPSSAVKSQLTNVTIQDGTISLTGYGLDCGGDLSSDSNICTQEKWNVLKTIKFKLDSTNGASKYYLKRV